MNKHYITIIALSCAVIILLSVVYFKSQEIRKMEMVFAYDNAWKNEAEIKLKIQAMIDFGAIKAGDVSIKKSGWSNGGSGIEIVGDEKSMTSVRSYIKNNIETFQAFNNSGLNQKYFTYSVYDNPTSIILEWLPKVRG